MSDTKYHESLPIYENSTRFKTSKTEANVNQKSKAKKICVSNLQSKSY
jgi:hypothetical protein